jgi:membrane-associated phospholipid phosphatase
MEVINTIEVVVNVFFQNLGDWLTTPMLLITSLGNEEFFILLLTALYWSFDQMVGLRVGMALLLGNGFNMAFKFIFHNPRPYWFSEKVKPLSTGESFGVPSGHSQVSASVWGWLACEVKKRWFTVTSLVIIFLVGLSRIYLGVHFLSDVLLGWTFGGLLVWAFSAWHRPVGEWLSRRSLFEKLALVLASTMFLILMILAAYGVGSPGWELDAVMVTRAGEIDPFNLDGAFTLSGTWFGLMTGYVVVVEYKGHFLAGQGDWKRIVRFLVGLVGVFIFWFGLGEIFSREANVVSYLLRFLRYSLTGLWVAWWAPLIFEKLKLLSFDSA